MTAPETHVCCFVLSADPDQPIPDAHIVLAPQRVLDDAYDRTNHIADAVILVTDSYDAVIHTVSLN